MQSMCALNTIAADTRILHCCNVDFTVKLTVEVLCFCSYFGSASSHPVIYI